MSTFILIIKDLSDFGKVGLQGVHQVLESESDVTNVLYNVERDGYDRVFVYLRGWDDASFDLEICDLISQLELAGGELKAPQSGAHVTRWNWLVDSLTPKQYAEVTEGGDRRYNVKFQRAIRASKRAHVKRWAVEGLKYCRVFGWTA
jgi:hypothetical protein